MLDQYVDGDPILLESRIVIYLNSLRARIFVWNVTIYLLSLTLLHTDMTQVIHILPREIHNLPIQYHDCWCSGDSRSQGISNHDTNFVKPSWLGPRMLTDLINYL